MTNRDEQRGDNTMISMGKKLGWMSLLLMTSLAVHAQEFKLFDRTVYVHGFLSQGFAFSNHNNYLTMDTSDGDFHFTDAALNLTSPITDKFRVGAQAYDRKIGKLGEGHLALDWAYGDYRFKRWLGMRVGKIKTVSGLYNDTQDDEFLQTWALMPQSIYPLDLRSTLLAHTGADLYGDISLHRAGSLSYAGFWGRVPYDNTSGWVYANKDIQYPVVSIKETNFGGDLRWKTPVHGLTTGFSYLVDHEHWLGTETFNNGIPYIFITPKQRRRVGYVDYQVGKWHLTGEGMVNPNDAWLWDKVDKWFSYPYGYLGWYVSAAYRINKRFEVGSYNSQYEFTGIPAPDHLFDRAACLRVDFNNHWDLKVEGHYMSGDGGAADGAAHGFYLFNNNNLQHDTTVLVLRSTVYF